MAQRLESRFLGKKATEVRSSEDGQNYFLFTVCPSTEEGVTVKLSI
jgi:hypothetical protein